MRTSLGELLVLVATISAFGCSEKDATKCQEALDGTRKSVAAADAALTNQWRDRAYKYCADQASLSALDKEISDKQSAEAAAKAAEAQRLALNAGLLKTFVTWAGDNKLAPDHASVSPKCDGDDPQAGAPKVAATGPKATQRLCTATRSAGNNTLTARYWEADKTIELFMTKAPAPASCDDLGPNKVLKSWNVPAVSGQSVKRTRCELSGSLSGMQAVVSQAANAAVYIFSPSYLEKDAALKKIAGE
jgi:hypothetical protein